MDVSLRPCPWEWGDLALSHAANHGLLVTFAFGTLKVRTFTQWLEPGLEYSLQAEPREVLASLWAPPLLLSATGAGVSRRCHSRLISIQKRIQATL